MHRTTKKERGCLKFAYENGFETSVSCEPMLDDNTISLVTDLQKYVPIFFGLEKPISLIED